MNNKLELYIHIPFCAKKCDYCDFLSGPSGKRQQRAYVDALCREIDGCKEASGAEVSSVFIGGGTPSLLPGEWICEIMEHVYRKFSVDKDAEISMEANPGTVDEEKLGIYRKSGINRISFGCQSADNKELAKLGRIHTWEEFLISFRKARAAGFRNINVDLMSGLPSQTLDTWENSLQKVIGLNPEHISAYSLIVEEGTPFAGQDLELPDEETERQMYEMTARILEQAGYQQYEISNYAKRGYACRHNIGYWNRTSYRGLGLGSASLVCETRFSNTRDMKEYLENSGRPETIRKETEHLDLASRIEEYMILGLRMRKGVSEQEFSKQFHLSMKKIYGNIIEKYVRGGFLEWEGDNLRLTRQGISVSNPVMADFLEPDI